MNPGKLNRRLTIQARTFTQDSTGGRVETWADAFQCWGELVTSKATEGIASNSEKSQDTRQFRIRWKSGIASGTHRVLYQLAFYDIEGITEEGIKTTLLLDCRSVQALCI